MKYIDGGVCAAKGFSASGIRCGIRPGKTKEDLSLILSTKPCSAAAVYTQNKVCGAPVKVTRAHLENGIAQAVICNSGIANTCAENGEETAEKTCGYLADALGIKPTDVIVASTGVIGQPLPLEPVKAGIPALISALSENGSDAAARGIMTTDTVKKEFALEFSAGGSACRMGGIAKGSGMIHPNMATMLVFITTDAAISPALLKKALSENVKDTFNMISVDGDTSTNDMVALLANGEAKNREIVYEDEDYKAFKDALFELMKELCRGIAADGEGATKLLECAVSGAATDKDARLAAKSVVCSSLLKAAMFGADANWGRILCAIGYSGADFDPDKTDVSFESAAGRLCVCKGGRNVAFSEEDAKKILSEKEIKIIVSIGGGAFSATAWGCDLTYDYVKINGDYRT
ncbi:MAG: bifunctional glutamate N-acetyltransferase/amino-acid acetyltransferase ArgJ [Clostridia bacterium]|nr:bifunctional glutamate N-acetyltransferase/amino-acid acetyltransferase ArgJ [Clostridia bacterium]